MKNLQHYLPLLFAILLSFGIVAGYYFEVSLLAINITLGTLLLLLLLLIQTKNTFANVLFAFFSLVLFFAIGVFVVSKSKPYAVKNHFSHKLTENENVTSIIIKEKLAPNTYYWRYKVNISSINQQPSTGKIILYVPKSLPELDFGKTYHTLLTFQKPSTALNPYDFDYRKYLQKQNIEYQSVLDENKLLGSIKAPFNINTKAKILRENIIQKIDSYPFGTDEKGILKALILGDKLELNNNIRKSYTEVGAIHILAISGLHIGMLYIMLLFLLKPLDKNHKTKIFKIIFIVGFMWTYALLVGLGGSVVRAVTMFTFVALTELLTQRKIQVIHTLIISYIFLLCCNPFYLFDIGFQLSYVAVWGIIWFYPLVYNALNLKNKFTNYFWKMTAMSLAATIATFPLTLYYFHQFPLLFAVSNLILIPLSGIILVFGIVFIVLALALQLPNVIVLVLNFLIKLMNIITGYLSQIEATVIRNIYIDGFYVLFLYLIILLLYVFWLKKSYFNLKRLLITVIIFQILIVGLRLVKKNQNEWVIFYNKNHNFIAHNQYNSLHVLSSFDSISTVQPNFILQYKNAKNIDNISYKKLNTNYLLFNQQTLYIIDSLGIYSHLPLKPDVVLLTQSPKIHFEKMLLTLQPKKVIVAGGNQYFDVSQWKKTVEKNNVFFYNIRQNGAYIEQE